MEVKSPQPHTCVGCERELLLDWTVCPFCITPKSTSPGTCDNCSRQISTSWAACAWCGVNLGGGPLVASMPVRREEATEVQREEEELPSEHEEVILQEEPPAQVEIEEEPVDDSAIDRSSDEREAPTSLAQHTEPIVEEEEHSDEPLPPEEDIDRCYRSPFDGDDALYTRQELEEMYERAQTYLPLKSGDVDANIEFLETKVLIDDFSLLQVRKQMARFTGERSATFYKEDGKTKGMGWTQEAILRFFGKHGYRVEDGYIVYEETLPAVLEAQGYDDLEAYLQDPSSRRDDTGEEIEVVLEERERLYRSPFEDEPDVAYTEEELRDLLEVEPRWPLNGSIAEGGYKAFIERHVLSDYSWQSCKQWMIKLTGSEFADFVDARQGHKGLEWSRDRILSFFEEHGYFVEDGEVSYKPRLTILEELGYKSVDAYIADWNNWHDDAVTDWNR